MSQQDKAKILNGDDKIVYNILYELKGIYSRHKKEGTEYVMQLPWICSRSTSAPTLGTPPRCLSC